MIDPGSITAVVGPSGSGKTTLLSIAGLLLRPKAGTVLFDGVLVNDRRCPSGIAWVLQTANALGHRSVLDNVALGLIGNGVSHVEARRCAGESLDVVGLGAARDRRGRELSGGELQRVNVARALIGGPKILFADEPTAHLDRDNADLVVRSILELRDPITSVVIATHDPLVSNCADRVVEVVNGRLFF